MAAVAVAVAVDPAAVAVAVAVDPAVVVDPAAAPAMAVVQAPAVAPAMALVAVARTSGSALAFTGLDSSFWTTAFAGLGLVALGAMLLMRRRMLTHALETTPNHGWPTANW